MPIFKKQDMWIPNKQYYSTNRQKSVVLYQDKLYVCNTTHTSTDTFDESKFTSLGGGSSFKVDLSGVNLTPSLINQRNGFIRETYNCTLQDNGAYKTIIPGNDLYDIVSTQYKIYGVSSGLINYPSTDIHTINFTLPDNFANGEMKYIVSGYCNESYSLLDIILNALGSPTPDFKWATNVILSMNVIGKYSSFIRTNDGQAGQFLPDIPLPSTPISLSLNSNSNQFKLNNSEYGEILSGDIITDVPLKAFLVVLSLPDNENININVNFNDVTIADFGDIDFGNFGDGDIVKVETGGVLGGITFKPNDLIMLYDNKQKGLLYYTSSIKRTFLLSERSVYGISGIFILDTAYEAHKKYRVKMYLIYSSDTSQTTIRITPYHSDRMLLNGIYSTMNNDTFEIYGKYYDGYDGSFTTVDYGISNGIIEFNGILNPTSSSGVLSINFHAQTSSWVYMKEGSYLEIEELI